MNGPYLIQNPKIKNPKSRVSPEEYERIKEAEKARLRSVKRLKDAVRALRRKRSVSEAPGRLTGARQSLERSTDAADRLAAETAQYEARLDLALDSHEARPSTAAAEEQAEATLRRQRAQELLTRLKAELGVAGAHAAPDASPKATEAEAAAPPSPPAASRSASTSEKEKHLPDKTIGRMSDDVS